MITSAGLSEFVHEVLRPQTLTQETPELPKPGFVHEDEAWSLIFDHVELLKIEPLFCEVLSRVGWWEQIPRRFWVRIENGRDANRGQQELLKAEFPPVIQLLIASKISVSLFGVADLARRYYADARYRPADSLDLLVPADQFGQTLRILGKAGYRAISGFEGNRSRLSLSRGDGAFPVAVYRSLIEGDSEEFLSEVWKESQEVFLPDWPHGVHVLGREDEFAYLIARFGAREMIPSPVLINDLYFVAARYPVGNVQEKAANTEMDWDRVIWGLRARGSVGVGWLLLKWLIEREKIKIPKPAVQKLNRSVSGFRRAMLAPISNPEHWFADRPRGWLWDVRSRMGMRG